MCSRSRIEIKLFGDTAIGVNVLLGGFAILPIFLIFTVIGQFASWWDTYFRVAMSADF